MAGSYYSSEQQRREEGGGGGGPAPLPPHLCLFLLLLLVLLVLSWYLNHEPAFEGVFLQLKLAAAASPLLLLLAVRWLSGGGAAGGPPGSFFLPLPERESLLRAGGSPWGVGLLLALLAVMVSYQSSFHGRWFPLLGR